MSKSSYRKIPYFTVIILLTLIYTPLIALIWLCSDSIIFALYVMVHRLNMLILVAEKLDKIYHARILKKNPVFSTCYHGFYYLTVFSKKP